MAVSSIAIVSYRLAGSDGVSIEAAKWQDALINLGHNVHLVAGSGSSEVTIIEGLAIDSQSDVDINVLEGIFDQSDLVIVENLCSLPLNPKASATVGQLLRGRPAILRHHDLSWQRTDTAQFGRPPDDPNWRHVTINQRSKGELAARGINAVCLYNRFAMDSPLGNRESAREYAGVSKSQRLIVQPTRALPRKNIPGALSLAESLHATYWLSGAAEDGYQETLDRLLQDSPVKVIRFLGDQSIDDLYAASDLVVLPSTWEGFGNPSLEAVTHNRPLAVGDYPVADEIRSFGFTFFDLGSIDQINAYLNEPYGEVLEQNQAIARAHFDLADLPRELNDLLTPLGFGVQARSEER